MDLPLTYALYKVNTILPNYFGRPGSSINSANNASIFIGPCHEIMARATRRLAAWCIFMSIYFSNENEMKENHLTLLSRVVLSQYYVKKKKVVRFLKEFTFNPGTNGCPLSVFCLSSTVCSR